MAALDNLAPRLIEGRAETDVKFYAGQNIDLHGISVAIETQNIKPDVVFASQNTEARAVVSVGSSRDFDDRETTFMVSKALRSIARRNAARLLLPRARQLAAQLGCHPSGWLISSGTRILGQCNGAGIIKLSYMNVFLTPELRDYVICHELAHLSELNHSPRFHHVCDNYLGGREKELIYKLKTFNWPLLRKV